MTTFHQLLDEFDRSASTTAAKGRRFEEFRAAFPEREPSCAERCDKVWLWSECPGRDGETDSGIDLVARERKFAR